MRCEGESFYLAQQREIRVEFRGVAFVSIILFAGETRGMLL